MKKSVPTINKDYIDYAHRKFEGLKELAFKRTDSIGCLGKMVHTTRLESTYDVEGIYILQNEKNPNIAYRIDEESNNYQNFDNFKQCSLAFQTGFIHNLVKRQSNIKNTDFPTGIVTVDHYCIGQEIVYYPGFITLNEYFKQNENTLIIPEKVYTKLLLNLKELNDNGIFYLDTHGDNFLTKDNEVKIIDFDPARIQLSDNLNQTDSKKWILINQQENIQKLINKSNKILGINEQIKLSSDNPLEDGLEKVLKLAQRYR